MFTYHVYAIWLFTASDIETIVGPSVFFAIVTGLARPAFGFDPSLTAQSILPRLPVVILWVWSNLLPFNIGNQASADAVQEDRINKPWRPLPSGRMEISTAKKISQVLAPAALLVSSSLFGGAGIAQAVALLGLGWWHNDLGGGDSSWCSKNFLNACGFLCYVSGALDVLLTRNTIADYNQNEVQWFLVIFAIVVSTVQSQDLSGQAGEKRARSKDDDASNRRAASTFRNCRVCYSMVRRVLLVLGVLLRVVNHARRLRQPDCQSDIEDPECERRQEDIQALERLACCYLLLATTSEIS